MPESINFNTNSCFSAHKVEIASATVIAVSLAAAAALLGLYLSGTLPQTVSLILMAPPVGSGVIAGAILLIYLTRSPPQAKVSLKEAIRKHQLGNAATRIFADPLRSFLELVVNSFDASVDPEKGVGKFGMGFPSILSFFKLKEIRGCQIHLETTYREENGDFKSYAIDIDELLSHKFSELKPREETGTTITIKPTNPFSQETLDKILGYLHHLQFYEHGRVLINGEISIGQGTDYLAYVTLEKDKLEVVDDGCGISRVVAETKLFTPSSSTKSPPERGEAKPVLPEITQFNGKTNPDQSFFLLSIGGVVVVPIPLDKPLPDQADIHLRMAPGTKLILSRDAVEFKGENSPAERYLKSVIDFSIERLLEHNLSSEALLGLHRGLLAWEGRTPSVQKARLSAYLEDQLYLQIKAKKRLPIPLELQGQLIPLLKSEFENVMVFLPLPRELLGNDFTELETFLIENWEDRDPELIEGGVVLFNDAITEVTDLGFRSVIFVPCSLGSQARDQKSLSVMVAQRYSEEGKRITPHKKHLSPSIVRRKTTTASIGLITTGQTPPKSSEDASPPTTQILEDFASWPDEPFDFFWREGIKNKNFLYLLNFSQKYFIPVGEFCPDSVRFDKSLLFQGIVNHNDEHYIFPNDESVQTFISLVDQYFPDYQSWERIFSEMKQSYGDQPLPVLRAEGGIPGSDYDLEMHNKPKKDGAFQSWLSNLLNSNSSPCTHLLPAQSGRVIIGWILWRLGVDIKDPESKIWKGNDLIWPIEGALTAHGLQKLFWELFPNLITSPERLGHFFPTHVELSCFQFYHPGWTPRGGGSEQELDAFIKYEKALKIEVREKVAPALLLRELVSRSEKIPPELKEETGRFVSSLLSLYHSYVTFTDRELKQAYGAGTSNFDLGRFRQFRNPHSICLYLEFLQERPDLYKKMLRLTLEEMREKFSLEERDSWMKSYNSRGVSLPFEPFDGVNVFFYAARTFEQNYQQGAWMLSLCNTPEELFYLSEASQHCDATATDANRKEALEYVLHFFIRKELSQEELRKQVTHLQLIYKCKLDEQPPAYDRSALTHFKSITSFLSTIGDAQSSFVVHPEFVEASTTRSLEMASHFTAKQLMNTVSDDAFVLAVGSNNLEAAIGMLQSAERETELQVLNQCIEHGSEREGWRSTLLECLQNSADAITSFVRENPRTPESRTTITFAVELVQEGEATPALMLKIADKIGMESLKILLINFLIPNFSDKKGLVGEMGNGAFQMYKEAQMVTVKTKLLDTGKITFLRVVPIREEGEVVDLSFKCVELESDEDFEGTEIRVLFQNESKAKAQIELEGVVAREFIRRTIGKTWIPLPNGKQVTLTLRTLEEREEPLEGVDPTGMHISFTDLERKGTPFAFLQATNPSEPGLVLTAGYPFKPLGIFLKELELLPPHLADQFSWGWCLNLPLGSYEPVQSRTQVKMDKPQKAELRRLVAEWLLARTLLDEDHGPSKEYLPHFNSPCGDFPQIHPNNRDRTDPLEALQKGTLTTFFLRYRPSFSPKRSFLDWIDHGYSTIVKDLSSKKSRLRGELKKLSKPDDYDIRVSKYQDECQEAYESWKKQILAKNKQEAQFLEQVIIPWFECKITDCIEGKIPSLDELKRQNPDLMTPEERETHRKSLEHVEEVLRGSPIPDIKDLTAEMLTVYCELFVQSIPMDKGPPPIALVYKPSSGFAGVYHPRNHRIEINLHSFKLTELLALGLSVAQGEPIEDGKGMELLMVTPGKAGTLNHELEHARRGSGHNNGGAHGEGEDALGRMVDFESCAASYARKAHREGLFDRWAEHIQLLFVDYSEERFLDTMKTLQALETDHLQALMQTLCS